MKRILFALLTILTFASCNTLNSSEKQLIGKWYGTGQRDNGVKRFTMEITCTFHEDKSFESATKCIRTNPVDGFENLNSMITFDAKYKGTWYIDGQCLKQKYSNVDVCIEDVDFIGAAVTNLDVDRMKEDFLKLSKLNIPSMKRKMMEPDSARIEILNDNHFVTIGKNGFKIESIKTQAE